MELFECKHEQLALACPRRRRRSVCLPFEWFVLQTKFSASQQSVFSFNCQRHFASNESESFSFQRQLHSTVRFKRVTLPTVTACTHVSHGCQ